MYVVSGLIFTIGSLLFTILLSVVYYSKKKFISIKNKLYRYLLLVEIVLLSSQIFTYLFAYFNSNLFLNLLVYRFHWIAGFLWLALIYYYTISILKNSEDNNIFSLIKNDKQNKIVTIFIIISLLIYFVMPFEKISSNNINYLPGLAAYYTIGYCCIIVLIIFISMLKLRKQTTKRNRVAIIIILIEFILTIVFQLLFPKISFYGIAFALQLYFLYFIIENPDLVIISELEQVKEEIEKTSKAKIDFLSNMSHEIRTPMNAIVGFSSSLLEDDNFDIARAKEDINNISSAGNNLLEIINNILDISKIESGKEVLDLKEYSIINMVNELSNIINVRLKNKDVKLIVDVEQNIPQVLYGDSTKIYQILLNMLTNSVKYTDTGKIKLGVSGEKITNNEEEYFNLKFKVSDTGYGIKKEDFDKIFEKFSRLDSAKTNEIEGTGLGLVITKKYVDLMGGKIWFESEYEVGTTFYVDISQKIINKDSLEENNNVVKDNNKNNEIDFIDCSSKSALIVDDNKLNIKVATRLLEPYKFNVENASNGRDCINMIKSDKKYDIIFLDHMMPEMDGIETIHILKKLDSYEIPPIVALTANAISGMKEMYLNEGFDDYLSKPINVMELNKIIKKYFDKEN